MKLQLGLRSEEAYRLLFEKFSRKRKRGWKVRSSKEPSLIVVTTGLPLPRLTSDLAGGLAEIAIEAKGKETEISFSFDFRVWYFSHFVFELIVAFLLFGFCGPKYLESHSLYDTWIIGVLVFGLFFIPLISRKYVKNAEKDVVAQSKAALSVRVPTSYEVIHNVARTN